MGGATAAEVADWRAGGDGGGGSVGGRSVVVIAPLMASLLMGSVEGSLYAQLVSWCAVVVDKLFIG
ncbi:MAG: hypothetical protein Q9M13_00905 [Mariprofundales bacterium]|nr:hypothetical protein [Mariprofundales bacterium]